MLCGVMDLPSPPSKFDRYVNIVGSAVEDVTMKSMKEAVEENDMDSNITVAFDGSWDINMKRVVHQTTVGDGDSKAFKTIEEMKPYGDCVQTTKLECAGQVQKRMGSRLRRLKTSIKRKKLSDGRTLDSKNRLAGSTIDIIQNYNGLAIRQNTDSVERK
ncbi:hypothetical protein PR048_002885 [Dryococelus australis]|uniref:Mutator-like transposase domain-containing protein n=1 Tax=Dryococelus australis TaxID=614101 RepID=A0ABQ9ILG1_9NEOP|nr:hypothetical protein PR048_002885 [Dryococelus australis]